MQSKRTDNRGEKRVFRITAMRILKGALVTEKRGNSFTRYKSASYGPENKNWVFMQDHKNSQEGKRDRKKRWFVERRRSPFGLLFKRWKDWYL